MLPSKRAAGQVFRSMPDEPRDVVLEVLELLCPGLLIVQIVQCKA